MQSPLHIGRGWARIGVGPRRRSPRQGCPMTPLGRFQGRSGVPMRSEGQLDLSLFAAKPKRLEIAIFYQIMGRLGYSEMRWSISLQIKTYVYLIGTFIGFNFHLVIFDHPNMVSAMSTEELWLVKDIRERRGRSGDGTCPALTTWAEIGVDGRSRIGMAPCWRTSAGHTSWQLALDARRGMGILGCGCTGGQGHACDRAGQRRDRRRPRIIWRRRDTRCVVDRQTGRRSRPASPMPAKSRPAIPRHGQRRASRSRR